MAVAVTVVCCTLLRPCLLSMSRDAESFRSQLQQISSHPRCHLLSSRTSEPLALSNQPDIFESSSCLIGFNNPFEHLRKCKRVVHLYCDSSMKNTNQDQQGKAWKGHRGRGSMSSGPITLLAPLSGSWSPLSGFCYSQHDWQIHQVCYLQHAFLFNYLWTASPQIMTRRLLLIMKTRPLLRLVSK